MATHLALLRGINVGGNNPIKMADLRACFEEDGFGSVSTYIQSGNVLFDAGRVAAGELTQRVERILRGTFHHYEASVVIRSRTQLRAIVGRAPRGFGAEPDRYRYDVIFLKHPLTATRAMQSVLVREAVDTVHAGTGVLYASRLVSRLTQSRLSRLASMPVYQDMTIRNWNTTTKLLALMEA